MGRGSIEIEWAGCTCSGAFHDVQIDHGGGDVGMTEKILNRSNVGAGFEQIGREGVTQGVGCDPLRDTGFTDRITDLAGHGVVVLVVAGEFTAAWRRTEGGGGKEPTASTTRGRRWAIFGSGQRAGDCRLPQRRSPGDPRVSNQACVRCWSAVPWR